MSAPVDVAVAVLIRSDGAVLLAQRPASKVYSGYWEFPGGKIEPGEPVPEALRREAREELGIEIERAYPWITRVFVYPHAKVRLHFYRVYAWRGEPRAVEHQAIAWQRPDAIELDPLLTANGPVIRSLMLPSEYAITRAGEIGLEPFLSRLEARLRGGLKLIQIREKTLAPRTAAEFAQRVVALAHAHGAKILVNSDSALAREIVADGVHLTAEQLRNATARPDFPLCGASCHSSEELQRAEALRAHLIVMDLRLPGFDGWEATRRLKSQPETKHIPIIVVTADTSEKSREKAFAAGCDDYELKPVDFEKLVKKIHSLLSRGPKA